MVVHWHKLGEVDIEYTSHISIVLAIGVLKIIKSSDKNKLGHFLAHPVRRM